MTPNGPRTLFLIAVRRRALITDRGTDTWRRRAVVSLVVGGDCLGQASWSKGVADPFGGDVFLTVEARLRPGTSCGPHAQPVLVSTVPPPVRPEACRRVDLVERRSGAQSTTTVHIHIGISSEDRTCSYENL